MKTVWLLAARYEGIPIVPVATIVTDFFPHLNVAKFIRKVDAGDIDIPLVRIEGSQKAAKGVALMDLATYLDRRMAEAREENDKVFGRKPTPRKE